MHFPNHYRSKHSHFLQRLGSGHAGLLDVGRSLASGGLLLEDKTRVTPGQGHGGQNNQGTLEHDEGDLVGDDLAGIALPELGDTVGATREDEEDGRGETAEEGGHPPAHVDHAARAPVAEHVVGKGEDEEEDDDHLEDQTRHGDINTHTATGIGFVAAGLGGQGTAGSLEDETHDIGGDEDPDEELGLEAGEVGREEDDGLGEGNVDGGRVEDGCDGKAD